MDKDVILDKNPDNTNWILNFILLCQGDFVSILGNKIYEIALGFWILDFTGSTVMMGTIMACSLIPSILFSPISGVVVDRLNRKWLIVIMNFIKGSIIFFIAIAVYYKFVNLWILYISVIMIGICSAFFNPSISSMVPDLSPKKKLMKANSLMILINTSGQIIGAGSGGFLFTILGAPFLFFFNSAAHLISGIFESFIVMPKKIHHDNNQKFLNEIKEGYSYIWHFAGLRYLFILVFILNFFAFMGLFLLMPLFKETAYLGPGLYGIAMGSLAAGNIAGAILLNSFSIKSRNRFKFYVISTFCITGLPGFIPILLWFPAIVSIAFTAGVMQGICFIIVRTVIQLQVQEKLRGRVFSLLVLLTDGTMPAGMIIGGILAEFIPLRILISSVFFISCLISFPILLNKSIKQLINIDLNENTPSLVEEGA